MNRPDEELEMTQLKQAKNGIVSDEVRKAAESEHIEPERLRGLIASGQGGAAQEQKT